MSTMYCSTYKCTRQAHGLTTNEGRPLCSQCHTAQQAYDTRLRETAPTMTTTIPTHTPTPWTVNDWNQKDGEIHIWAPGTPRIAELPLRYVSINEQKANATHIVRCVNERAQLLESLRGAVCDIEELQRRLEDEGRDTGDFEIDLRDYREVLARVEREE